MKKVIIPLFVFFITLTACESKEAAMKTPDNKKVSAVEKFDIEKFKELPWQGNPDYMYKEFLSADGKIKITMSSGPDNYYQTECPVAEDDMVCLDKLFYKDTLTLRTKAYGFKKGSGHSRVMGVWEHFDRNGKLIDKKDHDAHYQILWSDIEKILKKHKIPLQAITKIIRVEKIKSLPDTPYWEVELMTGEAADERTIEQYKFNSLTGKMIFKDVQKISWPPLYD